MEQRIVVLPLPLLPANITEASDLSPSGVKSNSIFPNIGRSLYFSLFSND